MIKPACCLQEKNPKELSSPFKEKHGHSFFLKMLHFLCPRKFPAKFSWNYLFGSEVDFLSHHCIFTVAITGYLPLKKALQFMLTHFEFPSPKNVLCLVMFPKRSLGTYCFYSVSYYFFYFLLPTFLSASVLIKLLNIRSWNFFSINRHVV